MNNAPLKVIFTDIDGVWTDGGMYYDNNKNEFKKFNTNDSLGILICKVLDIKCVIITGEKSEIVVNRAKKLSIEFCFQNVKDKLKCAREFCDKNNISLKDCAFIGDSLNDFKLLKEVGYSASPINGLEYIKKHVDFVSPQKGGDGAFLDFIQHLLVNKDNIDDIYSKIIKTFYTE